MQATDRITKVAEVLVRWPNHKIRVKCRSPLDLFNDLSAGEGHQIDLEVKRQLQYLLIQQYEFPR